MIIPLTKIFLKLWLKSQALPFYHEKFNFLMSVWLFCFRITSFAEFVTLVGKPYMWAQRICGLDFLPEEINVSKFLNSPILLNIVLCLWNCLRNSRMDGRSRSTWHQKFPGISIQKLWLKESPPLPCYLDGWPTRLAPSRSFWLWRTCTVGVKMSSYQRQPTWVPCMHF